MLWECGSVALPKVSGVYTSQLGGNQNVIMSKNCWNDLWTVFCLANLGGSLTEGMKGE